MRVSVSRRDTSSALNVLFISTGLKIMQKGKDYRTLDIVSPSVIGFIDRTPELVEQAPMMRLPAMYFRPS